VQWVEATRVLARPGDPRITHVSPGALVNQLVDVDVLSEPLAVQGPVGGEGDPFLVPLHHPALIKPTMGNAPPEGLIPDLVMAVEVIDVKTTDVGLDLESTVITPVLLGISNGMAVSTREATVVVQTI
jgi:hypothetical protein